MVLQRMFHHEMKKLLLDEIRNTYLTVS